LNDVIPEIAGIVGNARCTAFVVTFEKKRKIGTNGGLNFWGICRDFQTVPTGGDTGGGKPFAIAFDKAETAGSAWRKIWMMTKARDFDVMTVTEVKNGFAIEGIENGAVNGHFDTPERTAREH
jgi:hypothetical protein